jgi:hypothetical protein
VVARRAARSREFVECVQHARVDAGVQLGHPGNVAARSQPEA